MAAVAEAPVAQGSERAAAGPPSRLTRLRGVIEHAVHLLPTQGPITVFVHHNSCHAFEHLPFEEAVIEALRRFGWQPYLPEDRYREELRRGRIMPADLAAVLIDDLGESADHLLGFLGTRFHLRQAMLRYPLQEAPHAELEWFMVETDALRRFRDDAPPVVRDRVIDETRHWLLRDVRHLPGDAANDHGLEAVVREVLDSFGIAPIERWTRGTWTTFCLHLLWEVCQRGVAGIPAVESSAAPRVRHRDLLLQATGGDTDRLVHELLIRFCETFLDQGLANWPLSVAECGFLEAFSRLYRQPAAPAESWTRGLRRELRRLHAAGFSPLESIAESLELLGVGDEETEEYLAATLLALPGWAGMLRQMETNAEWTVRPAPPGTLEGYLAVRLVLERQALGWMARERLGHAGPLCELRTLLQARLPAVPAAPHEQRAFAIFQLAQVLGWNAADLCRLSRREWLALVREIDDFSGLERRRVFQRAYERRYRRQALDALAAHARRTAPPPERPAFQVVCCIDDREESLRRHLEEVAPECETFGAAGFYGVAMYYRGVADAHYRPLCPVVIKPQHYVTEDVLYLFEESHRRRAETRRALATASLHWHVGSRGFLAGILTALVGSLASIPMVTRILFPRTTARIRALFGRLVQPPPATQLQLERTEPAPGPGEGEIGYSVDEMASIVERILRDIGLLANFARLVIFAGHGSGSLNNPHESAYNCGACSGGRGGPNARAFAQMANDPRVRERLAARGLLIPRETCFLGAFHNTCDESVAWFDLDRVPASHRRDFEHARGQIDRARERNAHERCRRFESAKLTLTPREALEHVEERAEDLSQARPEYNHATNALCLVGRRWRTRGLFLDRRAFLTSYDPTQDDADHNILLRVLTPAIPVCAGISLEYYFSTVDTAGWGCGSKLPHNITSLLGVMEGAASDLRPGLSAQMTEIHEPLRILFVVETTPEAMLRIMDRNAEIARLCRNDWVQLATLDPDSPTIHVFRGGRFELYRPDASELPVVPSSMDWYHGRRDNLGFASIASEAAHPVQGRRDNGVPGPTRAECVR